MNNQSRCAFVHAQVACALAEIEGMRAENLVRAQQDLAPAYREADFIAIQNKYLIGHNAVIDYLGE